MDKKDVIEALNKNPHVYTCLSLVGKLYDKDYLAFEPETFKQDLGISDEVLGKIMAGIVLKTTSRFWGDIVPFEKIALALNNRSVSFTEYQELSPAEIAWAVTEAGFITHPEPLDDDVKIYIAKILHDEGYDLAPFPLGETQGELNNINKTHRECFDDSGAGEERQLVQRTKHDAVNDYVLSKLIELLNS
jgi:hypothetical protein